MIDFIGVGAQKSGTSWVYACLYEHPEVCAPVKEIHFFSRPRFEKGAEWYESHFRSCNEGKKKGEFSTSYLYSSEAPERIHNLYPETRLIAILRNPKDRAYSQYRNAIKAGEIAKDTSFVEYTEQEPSVYEQGMYSQQLDRYYKYFYPEQVLVLVYEDSKRDPAAFMRKIYEFIGVDSLFEPSMLHREVNVARTPRLIFIERIMHKVAEGLRKVGLDKLVWVIRKSGLPDLVRRSNTAANERSYERSLVLPDAVEDKLREDAMQLSKMVGRDVAKEWGLK